MRWGHRPPRAMTPEAPGALSGVVAPAGTVEDGNGYWARLSSSDTSDILANDLKTTATMYLTVRSSDNPLSHCGLASKSSR